MEFFEKVFSLPACDTEDAMRRSKFLLVTIMSGIIFDLMIVVLSIIFHWPNGLIVSLGVLLFFIISFTALKKKLLTLSAALTLTGMSLGVLVNMYLAVGIYDLSAYLIPLIIIIAAFLLKKQWFIHFSVILILTFTADGLLAWYFHRKLPTPLHDFYGDLVLLLIFFSFIVIIMSLFVTFLFNYIEASKDKEKRIQNIFNSIQDVYFELDLKGYITQINKSAEIFFHQSVSELLKQNFFSLFENSSNTFNKVFSEEQISAVELVYDKKIASVNLTLIKDEDNNPAYIVGSMRDITALKENELKLLHSQKMEVVGNLVGGISHDFNNLLTVINGYSSIIIGELPKESSLYEYFQLIEQAGVKAADLTRKLLAFSRKQIYKPQTVFLNQLVLDFEKMLKRVIEEDIQLKIHIEEPLDAVFADPVQIEQIIMNLIVNARDAVKNKEGTDKNIYIKVSNYFSDGSDIPEGDYVLLEVRDDGIGMSPEIQKKIFEPFFTTKGKGKGTGLGLSTVLGIVEQNKGYLKLESEEGKGTVFRIYWSQIEKQNQTSVLTEEANPALTGKQEKILLVEDDNAVRSFGEIILRKHHYRVFSFSNAQDVLVYLKHHKDIFQVLITDLVMPGMNGKELSDKISAIIPGIKIIYTSGYASEKIIKNWKIEDNAFFLQKPYAAEALLKAVHRLFS